MKKMVKMVMTLMLLTGLMACNQQTGRGDGRAERDDRFYRAAMDDYAAGRLDAAIIGLEKSVQKDPDNSRARFQLACLLQDHRKDYIGAFCSYREYLIQQPNSDKAHMAKDRMALCEKEVAKILAKKHGFSDGSANKSELEGLRVALAAEKEKLSEKDKEIAKIKEELNGAVARHDRLVKAMKGTGSSEDVKALPVSDQARALLDEGDNETKFSKMDDISALRDEEKDELASGTSLLPERKPEDNEKRRLADEEKKRQEMERRAKADAAPSHPDTYTVQEGDTLYHLASRFYGTMHAWKKIREANKALISSDGRLRAGDVIKLP